MVFMTSNGFHERQARHMPQHRVVTDRGQIPEPIPGEVY